MGMLDKYTAANLFAIMCGAGIDPPLATALLDFAYGDEGGKGKVRIIAGHLIDHRSGGRIDLSSARLLFILVLQSEAKMHVMIESIYGKGAPEETLLLGSDALPQPALSRAAVAPAPQPVHQDVTTPGPPPHCVSEDDWFDSHSVDGADSGDFVYDFSARAAFYRDDVVPRTEMPLADRNKFEAIITAHRAGVMPEPWALVQMELVLKTHNIAPEARTAWAASMFKNLLARPHDDIVTEDL